MIENIGKGNPEVDRFARDLEGWEEQDEGRWALPGAEGQPPIAEGYLPPGDENIIVTKQSGWEGVNS